LISIARVAGRIEGKLTILGADKKQEKEEWAIIKRRIGVNRERQTQSFKREAI